MKVDDHSLSHLPFPLRNIALFICFVYGFIFRHYKVTIITFKNLFFVKKICVVLYWSMKLQEFSTHQIHLNHTNIVFWIQNSNFQQKVASLYPCLQFSNFLSNVNLMPIQECGVSFYFIFLSNTNTQKLTDINHFAPLGNNAKYLMTSWLTMKKKE